MEDEERRVSDPAFEWSCGGAVECVGTRTRPSLPRSLSVRSYRPSFPPRHQCTPPLTYSSSSSSLPCSLPRPTAMPSRSGVSSWQDSGGGRSSSSIGRARVERHAAKIMTDATRPTMRRRLRLRSSAFLEHLSLPELLHPPHDFTFSETHPIRQS